MALRSRLSSLSSQLPKEATAILGRFSNQLNGYEKHVKGLVKDFELRSREAREKSRKSLDQFVSQIRRTRTDVEKRVVGIVNVEGKRLNKRVGEVVNYLKAVSMRDTASKKPTKKTGSKKSAGTKRTSKSKKKAGQTVSRMATAEVVGESLSQA